MSTAIGTSAASPDVALQYHCLGGFNLAANTNLSSLHKVLALPSSTDLENVALTRISDLLANNLRLARVSSSALIRPLLSDVVQRESLATFGKSTAKGMSFIMAVHLEAERAQFWQDDFVKILGNNGEVFAVREFSGRRWKIGRSNSLWIISARDWVLLGCGNDFSSIQDEYLEQIQVQGRPVPALQQNWLEADLSSVRFGGWLGLLKPSHITISVAPNQDNLHINAKVHLEEPISWSSAPWQIPKALVRGPIISFTAAQNLAAFVNMNPAFVYLSSNPLTNQFYFWALDQMPFLNYMACPAVNASNELKKLSTEAPAVLNPLLERFNGTELVWNATSGKLAWLNMGSFIPLLEATQSHDGQFLFFYGFPPSPQNKPAPPALFSQIEGYTNVVYYDWELTGRRIGEWQILGRMIANRAKGTNDDAVSIAYTQIQWEAGVAGSVGKTVTKITRVTPNELYVERNAALGFTAIELILLADWICDANSGPIYSPHLGGKNAPLPFHP